MSTEFKVFAPKQVYDDLGFLFPGWTKDISPTGKWKIIITNEKPEMFIEFEYTCYEEVSVVKQFLGLFEYTVKEWRKAGTERSFISEDQIRLIETYENDCHG